jgi:TonB family protein
VEENLLHDWQKRFQRYVVYSLFLHLALALFFTVRTLFISTPEIDVSSAMLVDLVALPDKVIEESPLPTPVMPTPEKAELPTKPADIPKPAEIKVQPSPKKVTDAINLDRTKKKQSDALKKLQQQDALERLQNEMDREARSKAVENVRKQFKGNVISPGSTLTGTQRFVQQSYTNDIDRIFRSNWSLPPYLRGKDLTADVTVKFDEQGNVIATNMVKSSGNAIFDEMVLTAVRKSSPVPPPPEQFVDVAKMVGFLFRFGE